MSTGDFAIRFLQGGDAARFQALRLEALRAAPEAFASSYEEEVDRPLSVIEQRLAGPDGFVVGAFDPQDRLVGVAGFVRQAHRKMAHKGLIWGMYVQQAHRGRGLGRRLLQQLLRRAAALPGIEQVQLGVMADNTAAQALYQSFGFQAYGLERAAIKLDGRFLDEILMALFLPAAAPSVPAQ
jgi:RimJ/RimL family protein N-acetyltransferase